jgi:CRISPR type IV-associated protein Csf1
MGLDITSSCVVATALGIHPDGVPADTACECALCGLHINQGDLAAPLTFSGSFMDDIYMAARGQGNICGYCTPLMSIDGLRMSGYGAFGADGAKPFRKWADIASALMEPPEPPFVMVYATANNQHMAWRAPVNLSRDAYRVRVGLRDLLIRRAALRAAIEDCRLTGEAMGYKTEGKKTLPHPFAMLSPDLKDVAHARFRRITPEAAQLPGFMEAIARIRALTLGETWALRFVLTSNAGATPDATESTETD